MKSATLCVLATALLGVSASTAALAEEAPNSPARMMRSSSSITIGHRTASVPFSYLDAQGKPAGYSIELCGYVVDALRKQLALPELKVNYVPLTSSDRVEKVRDGTVDLDCGSTTITPQRAAEAAFSRPIFFANTKVLVRADAGIRTIADLKDKRVIVNQGAIGAPLLAKMDVEKGLHLQYVKSRDNVESFKALQQKKVDAFVHDDVQLAMLVSTSGDPKGYVLLDESLSSDPIGIMMRKDNVKLKQAVDGALARIGTAEMAKIYARWFMTPTFKFPMGDALKRELAGQAGKAAD